MDCGTLIPSMLRPPHAFICVEVILDGKRVGRQGSYMNVESDLKCKQFLSGYVKTHAPDSFPLPDFAKVTMQCTKLSDTVQFRSSPEYSTIDGEGRLLVCEIFVE